VKIYQSIDQLCQHTFGIIQIYPDEPSAYVLNKARLWADNIIDVLFQTALFAESEDVKSFSHWLIREIGKQTDNFPASLHSLYQTLNDDSEIVPHKIVIPAIDISGMTYEMARAVFRARQQTDTGPVIIELDDSNLIPDTEQLSEHVLSVIAAAIKEQHAENGWGPIFIKRNLEIQVNRSSDDLEEKLRDITDNIDQLLDAGIYNINIDASVRNGEEANIESNLAENARMTAELLRYIRSKEPKNTTVTVSGTLTLPENQANAPEQLRTFMQEFQQQSRNEDSENDLVGITTINLRSTNISDSDSGANDQVTGSDFNPDMLKNLSKIAREEFDLFGIVPRDISQLSAQTFSDIFNALAIEFHSSRNFLNFVLDHPRFPHHLRNQIRTDFQEKNLIQIQQHLWNIEPQSLRVIMHDLENEFITLFNQMGIAHSAHLLQSYFQPAN